MSVWKTLNVRTKTKNQKKRVGRGDGSGRGNFSTRGHDGQSKRSGKNLNPRFEGGQVSYFKRFAQLRGFHNMLASEVVTVTLSMLEKLGADTIDARSITKKLNGAKVKVVGNKVGTKLKVTANFFSKGAKEAIEAKGGEVIVV